VQFLGGKKKMKTRAKINEGIEPKVTITIRIPLREKIALVEEAKRKNITVTELIRRALQETIGIQKKTTQWPRPRALGIRKFTRKDLYE